MSNEENIENRLLLKLTNIKNDIFKHSKNSKINLKTPKNQILKKSNSHLRRPQMKKKTSENKLLL